MTDPLSGHFSVEASARTVRHYRYAVERMMRMLGGWIALTPELPAKLLMGRHVWDNAQHADALGRRLPELRAPAQVSEPSSPGFAAFMDAVEAPELPHQTVERVAGVYRVLKPHLLDAYEMHLAQANAVYEPPTRRILARCAEDERRHIAAGVAVLEHVVGGSPALAERVRARRAALEDLLRASGGVTGSGRAALAPDPGEAVAAPGDEGPELIRLERPLAEWPVPVELDAAVRGLGDALRASDLGAAARWLAPGAQIAPGVSPALAAVGDGAWRVVALAKIGRQRFVKARFQGAARSMALSMRWVPADGGWRAAVVDLSDVEVAHPA